MKRKIWVALLSAAMLAACAFGFAACGEGGGTEQGGTEQGGTEQGGTEQGGTEQGGTEQGGTEQGGTEQGGTEQGGAEQGGTVGLEYQLNYDGYTVNGIGTATETDIVIPSTYNGLPVTEISVCALGENVNGVSSLVLPDSLLSLPKGLLKTFDSSISDLSSLTLPFVGTSRTEGCALKSLFDSTSAANAQLPDCLSSVTVTDCSSVCDGAFSSAINLTSIRINDGCTSIGSRAFSACTSLSKLYLPASLRSVSDDAFSRSFSHATDPSVFFSGDISLWSSLTATCDIPDNVSVFCNC